MKYPPEPCCEKLKEAVQMGSAIGFASPDDPHVGLIFINWSSRIDFCPWCGTDLTPDREGD